MAALIIAYPLEPGKHTPSPFIWFDMAKFTSQVLRPTPIIRANNNTRPSMQTEPLHLVAKMEYVYIDLAYS